MTKSTIRFSPASMQGSEKPPLHPFIDVILSPTAVKLSPNYRLFQLFAEGICNKINSTEPVITRVKDIIKNERQRVELLKSYIEDCSQEWKKNLEFFQTECIKKLEMFPKQSLSLDIVNDYETEGQACFKAISGIYQNNMLFMLDCLIECEKSTAPLLEPFNVLLKKLEGQHRDLTKASIQELTPRQTLYLFHQEGPNSHLTQNVILFLLKSFAIRANRGVSLFSKQTAADDDEEITGKLPANFIAKL